MKKTAEKLKPEHLEGSPRYKKLFQAVEGKPFNKKAPSFTGQKDVDFLILQKIDDVELSNLCVVNSYINNLCKDESFWRNRLLNKYSFLLGNTEQIVQKYKPKNILWKDYYIWLNSALDGDPFFVYVYADSIGRKDVTDVLEYEMPDIFSDMDEIFQVNEDFGRKITNQKYSLSPTILNLPGVKEAVSFRRYLDSSQKININLGELRLFTKRMLFYMLSIFAIEESRKKLDKNKRFTYQMDVFEKQNLGPLDILTEILSNIHEPNIPITPEIKKSLTDLSILMKNHFKDISKDGYYFEKSFYDWMVYLGFVGGAASLPIATYLIRNFLGI